MKLSRCLTFPHRLNDMLEDSYNNDVIGWQLDGRSFSIRDLKAFEGSLLPRYFRHAHFTSFVRQLNMYNFHKVRGATGNQLCFKNAQFFRGNPLNNRLERKVASKKDISRENVSPTPSADNLERVSEQACSETRAPLESRQKQPIEFENVQPIPDLIGQLAEEVRNKDLVLECDIQYAVEQMLRTETYKSIDSKFLPLILESLGLEPQKRLRRQMSIRTQELLAMEPDQPSMKLIL